MNRRQLAFIVLVNGLVSLVIALGVVWVFEIRRPEAEQLALLNDQRPGAVLASTPVLVEPAVAVVVQTPVAAQETQSAPAADGGPGARGLHRTQRRQLGGDCGPLRHLGR